MGLWGNFVALQGERGEGELESLYAPIELYFCSATKYLSTLQHGKWIHPHPESVQDPML